MDPKKVQEVDSNTACINASEKKHGIILSMYWLDWFLELYL